MFRLFVLNKKTHTLPRLPAGLGPSLVFALGLPTTQPLCRLDSTAGSSGGSLDHQLQVGPAPRPGLSSFLTVITTRTILPQLSWFVPSALTRGPRAGTDLRVHSCFPGPRGQSGAKEVPHKRRWEWGAAGSANVTPAGGGRQQNHPC